MPETPMTPESSLQREASDFLTSNALNRGPGGAPRYGEARNFLAKKLGLPRGREEDLIPAIRETVQHKGLQEGLIRTASFDSNALGSEAGRNETKARIENFQRLIEGGELEGKDVTIAGQARDWYLEQLNRTGRTEEQAPELEPQQTREEPHRATPPETADTPPRPERDLSNLTPEQEQEMLDQARLLKQIADSLENMRGRLPEPEVEDLKKDPLTWVRKRLDFIESIEDTANLQNLIQHPMQELLAALPILREMGDKGEKIEEEIWTRKNLHFFYLTARSSTVRGMFENAGYVGPAGLQRLFRLEQVGKENFAPVAEAFRQFEKVGHDITAVQDGTKAFKDFKQEVVIRTAKAAGNGVAQKDEKSLTEQEKKEIEKEWGWAGNLAYKLWYITRAAYFDAYNTAQVPKIGKNGEVERDEDNNEPIMLPKKTNFNAGSANFFMRRILNLPELVNNTGTGVAFFRDYRIPEGKLKGKSVLDLDLKDFWTEKVSRILEKMEKDNGFIKSLAGVEIEKIDFTENLAPADVVLYFDKLNKADSVRAKLVDPGMFLQQPTERNLAEVWKVLEHLSEKENDKDGKRKRQEWFSNIVQAVVEFRRRQGLGSSHAYRELRWEIWNSQNIHAFIANTLSQGWITPPKAQELQSRFNATPVQVETQKVARSVLEAIPDLLFSWIGGGGKR